MTQSKRKAALWEHIDEPANTWDEVSTLLLRRKEPGKRGLQELEPGVNFFVLMLEQMGIKTFFSCEGHPEGFYVEFEAKDRMARRISGITTWFYVELADKPRRYILRMTALKNVQSMIRHSYPRSTPEMDTIRTALLRKAARLWQQEFGKLMLAG